ncbi:hypothetical protein ACN2XU_06435 [Primorskyibacter sp. 2E107]|uniref:hypothetical protein n=1 Tax=Primorskyibacter sp. 2E107 TaxID=3403458 RepID=UPI003AF764A7
MTEPRPPVALRELDVPNETCPDGSTHIWQGAAERRAGHGAEAIDPARRVSGSCSRRGLWT